MSTAPTAPVDTSRLAPATPGEPVWFLDAFMARTEAARAITAAGLDESALATARIASLGLGLLTHFKAHRIEDLTDADLDLVLLTPGQGRAWDISSGILTYLRVTTRGNHGRTGVGWWMICTGCGRWLMAPSEHKAKSCPLTKGCAGPLFAPGPAVPTSQGIVALDV